MRGGALDRLKASDVKQAGTEGVYRSPRDNARRGIVEFRKLKLQSLDPTSKIGRKEVR